MSENNSQELQKLLDTLKKENEELKASVAASEAAGNPSPLVKGSVVITLEKPDGGKEKKKVGFKDGRKKVRLANGNIVSSEAFLKVCNNKKLTEEELSASWLKGLSQEDALAHLTNLVTMGASMIEEKK